MMDAQPLRCHDQQSHGVAYSVRAEFMSFSQDQAGGPGHTPLRNNPGQSEWADRQAAGAPAILDELGPDAAQRFDSELLHFQRRRAIGYCLLVMAVLIPTFVLDLLLALNIDFEQPDAHVEIADPIIDVALLAVYGAFAVLLYRTRRSRRRLMQLFFLLLTIVCTLMIIGAMTLWSDAARLDPDVTPAQGVFIASGTAITIVLILHLLASIFVSLSPREALLPMIPLTMVYVVLMFAVVEGPLHMKLIMLAAWIFAGGPGVLWSTRYYRRFVDAFRWRSLRAQLGDMRHDLAYARRVHEALFPLPLSDGPLRMNYCYEPMRDVGGDYLFAQRRADNSVLVVLVDVAGHGVASALAASRMHVELERLVEERPDVRPGDVLFALNRYVYRTLADQGVFASAVAILVPVHGTPLRWASAGHPAALFFRSDGKCEQLGSTATLLGVLEPGMFAPGEAQTLLGERDVVVACTDGVHEAADLSGAFFGDERLMSIATTAAVGGGDRVAPATMDAVRRHRAGREASDDVLIVSVWGAA